MSHGFRLTWGVLRVCGIPWETVWVMDSRGRKLSGGTMEWASILGGYRWQCSRLAHPRSPARWLSYTWLSGTLVWPNHWANTWAWMSPATGLIGSSRARSVIGCGVLNNPCSRYGLTGHWLCLTGAVIRLNIGSYSVPALWEPWGPVSLTQDRWALVAYCHLTLSLLTFTIRLDINMEVWFANGIQSKT